MPVLPLSLKQAKKLALLSQRLPPAAPKGDAKAATLAAIEHLGYIQIDTISVIERAHHHTLWNRNPRYKESQLDALLCDGDVFEYWSHAAAYLPMRDYRFSLPRKRAIASEAQDHWGTRDKPLMKQILRRIADEGPLMARDFDKSGKTQSRKNPGDWSRKPAKRALEYLYMQGELMVPRRERFQKVYELTERVLTDKIDTRVPSTEDYARFLITSYLRAHGLGRAEEMTHLLKGMKTPVSDTLREMVLVGELLELSLEGNTFFAAQTSLDLLDKPLTRNAVKILSPFDNLVIHRKRLRELFGFDYLIECYVPAAKRRYGYFVLPVLWRGELVARMDCKADRRRGVLEIHQFFVEPGLRDLDSFANALSRELKRFLSFCRCEQLLLHKTSPAKHRHALHSALNTLSAQ
ncbi:MAG: winged helix-turn-helix domain-containing protein [Congregibacter sp.]